MSTDNKAVKINRFQDLKRRFLPSNSKNTQTEHLRTKSTGVQSEKEKPEKIKKTKTSGINVKPESKMTSSQTLKKIFGTKSIQIKDEKVKDPKMVNRFVQTLADANTIERLKKEVARLKNANEDFKIEKLQLE